MADTLFDATPYVVELPPPGPKLSEQRRRTIRQEQAIANGVHPLGLALGSPIRMHPDAPRDRTSPGPRCGSCWYRTVLAYRKRSYGKCLYGLENETDSNPQGYAPRVTHGAGTDVRSWWGACLDYSPGEPAMSRDASRFVPRADPLAINQAPAGAVSSAEVVPHVG